MIDLKELNSGMLASGRLSEIHDKNLKTYPFIAFDNLDTVEINYNLEPLFDPKFEGEPYVEYILKFKGSRLPSKVEESAEILIRMVQTLLWKKVRVDVAYRRYKELIYVRKQEPKQPRAVRSTRKKSSG